MNFINWPYNLDEQQSLIVAVLTEEHILRQLKLVSFNFFLFLKKNLANFHEHYVSVVLGMSQLEGKSRGYHLGGGQGFSNQTIVVSDVKSHSCHEQGGQGPCTLSWQHCKCSDGGKETFSFICFYFLIGRTRIKFYWEWEMVMESWGWEESPLSVQCPWSAVRE